MIISSGPTNLSIICPPEIERGLANSPFLESYIPAPRINPQVENISGTLILKYANSSIPDFTFSDSEASFTGKLIDSVSLEDIVTVIDYCLEYYRQKESIYCLHGSSVSQNNQGIIFFGSISGLGKTTLALNLCSHHHFDLVGDEKVLINKDFQIIGGCQRLRYNKQSLYDSTNPKLDNLPPSKLNEEISLNHSHVPIKLLILPILLPNSSLLETDSWDEAKTNFHLYEELTRKIRGVSRRIQDFSLPLPSLDTPKISRRRSEYCHILSQRLQVQLIKGGTDPLIRHIISLLANQDK